jgi:hypothetical protein
MNGTLPKALSMRRGGFHRGRSATIGRKEHLGFKLLNARDYPAPMARFMSVWISVADSARL